MRNQHVWRETTSDGDKREVRAVKFANRWRLQAKVGRDAEWTYFDRPSLEDLHTLRDLIWRKYQRRRASYDDLTSLDRLISERQMQEAPGVGSNAGGTTESGNISPESEA